MNDKINQPRNKHNEKLVVMSNFPNHTELKALGKKPELNAIIYDSFIYSMSTKLN